MEKRDLEKDLAICEAATPGPWYVDSQGNIKNELFSLFWSSCAGKNDSRFITEAREGWPHAIKRAIEAEKEVEELQKALRGAAEIANIASGHLNEFKKENEKLKKLLLYIEKKLGSQYHEILRDY